MRPKEIRMTTLIKDKVALVTGAGSGIGRAIAVRLASEGAKLVVSDIDEPGGVETVQQIRALGGSALFVRADTSSASDGERLVAAALREHGALHIAVNNAGIGGPSAPVGEYPIEGW